MARNAGATGTALMNTRDVDATTSPPLVGGDNEHATPVASNQPCDGSTSTSGSASIEALVDTATDDSPVVDETSKDAGDAASTRMRKSPLRIAAVVGLAALVAVTSLTGWLGYRDYQSRQAQERRELFLQVGRQGALNLTTIDWQHAEADIQRVLDSSTGAFYDDFSKRSQPFIDVVKKAQAKSTGTVTEAGLESDTESEGQVLVAVHVDTSNLGAAQQEPRYWRMRISVEKVGDGAKVSKVEFVP